MGMECWGVDAAVTTAALLSSHADSMLMLEVPLILRHIREIVGTSEAL
jgi:hypothetical protein